MNLRRVRKKIKTITNVSKITKAMQMVAAVKMKKAQQRAIESRVYREMLDAITRRVMTAPDASYAVKTFSQGAFFDKNKAPKNSLYVVVASNKGLCGSFNVNLFRFLIKEANWLNDGFIIVGKKAAEFVVKMGGKIIADFSNQQPVIDVVSPIFSLVFRHFFENTYKATYLVYNEFISTFKIIPAKKQLLPFEKLTNLSELTETAKMTKNDYLIEPSYEIIFEALIKDALKEKIKTALLDNEAGEHAARMLAMKNATDNAADITYNLTLLRNKLRQQAITYELLDMIAAKESTVI